MIVETLPKKAISSLMEIVRPELDRWLLRNQPEDDAPPGGLVYGEALLICGDAVLVYDAA